jgi:nitrous oxide reductase
MSAPKPVALGYTCGPDGTELQRQLATITAYSATEGLTLADVLHDESDACTISQLVQVARQHDAVRVILPAGVRLADARVGLERDLAEHHTTCVVLPTDDADLATSVALALIGPRSTGVTP